MQLSSTLEKAVCMLAFGGECHPQCDEVVTELMAVPAELVKQQLLASLKSPRGSVQHASGPPMTVASAQDMAAGTNPSSADLMPGVHLPAAIDSTMLRSPASYAIAAAHGGEPLLSWGPYPPLSVVPLAGLPTMIHGSMPTVCTNVGWSQQDASASRSGSPRANRRVETNGNRLARAVPPTSPTVSVTSGGGFASGGLASMAKEEDDWRIDWSEVLLERLIGSGAAGMTYAAQWQGATVAVKIATPCASGRESWRAEVRALTRLHHPNVVRCLGTIVAPPTYCLVLEYCDGGDVRQALNQPPTPTMFFWRVAEV